MIVNEGIMKTSAVNEDVTKIQFTASSSAV